MKRRTFLQSVLASGVASAAKGMGTTVRASAATDGAGTHWPAKCKRVIYLFQSGAPSQIDLFDPKPGLRALHGKELPANVRAGQRLTGMSANQASLPIAASPFEFSQHGESGAWISELLPSTAKIADRLCIVRSMFTEAINHDPAITFFQTGSAIAGRPSFGSWISHALGTDNPDLPSFLVLVSAGQGGQPLYARLWGSGFLDARHQGVQLRAGASPVLYLVNPPGVSRRTRRAMLDALSDLEKEQLEREHDARIASRMAQYELAYRMQESVPALTDVTSEPDSTFELYGEDAHKPGTFAANCLLARRFAEAGVRFVQLYHQGWDNHGDLPRAIAAQAKETDRASAALILDLERRGLLDDTLVVWGGEFGRTTYSQGKITKDDFGRDHHPRCFSIWLAGGGVRAGTTYGRTDDYSYNIVDESGAVLRPTKDVFTKGAVHVHDLQATLLALLGIDHERLSVLHQGRRFRLTDVHGHVVRDLMS
ncbi:MAG: DUF1501 domain-containing protein [Planctomycetes bacterium]|nr:DUF1501 domain-containing protein [Planctomycetota bacterium]MCB9918438.1 DUF1501 domain-containing protein [Planctomycetota bacterium]